MVRRLVVCRVLLFFLVLFANASHAEEHEIVFSSSFDHAKVSVFRVPSPSPHMSGFLNFAYRGRVIALAKGLVKVPADAFVSLEITAKDGYLDFFASLPKNGIDRLELRGAKISTSLLQQLERLESVRQLVLVDCVTDEIDFASLHGAVKLQSVSIESRQNSEQSRLVQWFAKCPSLQSIPDDRPLSVDQLKMLQQHHGPLFLNVKLDNNAIDTLDALAAIPGLAGVQVEISKEVPLQDLARLVRLANVEVITLNDGLFNAGLVGVLGQIPRLRILRVQGETAVENDFLDAFAKLTRIEAVTFTRSLPVDVQRRFADTMLRMQNVCELPRLVNATAEQLDAIASRNHYRSLEIVGLDRSSDEMRLAKAIRNNPALTHLLITNMRVMPDLGSAICNGSSLQFLRTDTEQFDGQSIASVDKLTQLKSLDLSSKKQPLHLDVLRNLPNLETLQVSFHTLSPNDVASLGSIKSLSSLRVDSGFSDDSLAASLKNTPDMRGLSCNQDCLMSDAGIDYLADCKRLEHLQIGGFLSESAIAKLSELSDLQSLSVRSDLLDEAAIVRLRKVFQKLEYFDARPLDLSMGKISQGSDGRFRWVPASGRTAFDELEKSGSLATLLTDHLASGMVAKLRDKVVLVEFWGTWCGPCLAYTPELERIYDKYRDLGVEFLSIHSQQGAEKADEYLANQPLGWPTVVDSNGEFAKRFRVPSYPSLYLFNSKGELVVALPHRLLLEPCIESVRK